MAEPFPTIVHLLGLCPTIMHLLGSRVARLALCIRGTLGKGTLCMYPSLRVPTMGTVAMDDYDSDGRRGGNSMAGDSMTAP